MFDIKVLLIFLFFNIVWIQVPGLLLAKALLPAKFTLKVRVLAGYFLGFALMALLFLVESILHAKGILLLAGPIMTVTAVGLALKNYLSGQSKAIRAVADECCDNTSIGVEGFQACESGRSGIRKNFRPSFYIIFGIIYLVSFLSFQYWYAAATSGATTVVYHDFLFHTGNIVALSRSFIAPDIRVSGVVFHYHYFMELIYGLCKHIFKVDAFSLYMNGNAFVCAWPLALALTIIGDKIAAGHSAAEVDVSECDESQGVMTEEKVASHSVSELDVSECAESQGVMTEKKVASCNVSELDVSECAESQGVMTEEKVASCNVSELDVSECDESQGKMREKKVTCCSVSEKMYFVYSFGTMLSMVAMYPLIIVGAKFPLSWTDNHLFTNANAMGLCVALTVLVLEFIAAVWNDSLKIKNIISLFLLMFVTTGFKGNAGISIAAIIAAVFIVEVILVKKFSISKLLYVFTAVVAFAVTYLGVDVGLQVSGSNNRATKLSPQGTLDFSRVGEVFEKVLHLDYMKMPWMIIALILCVLVIVGPLCLPLFAWMKQKFEGLFKTRQIGEIYDWFALGLILIALVSYCTITIEGLSQAYMVIGVSPLIFYAIMRLLQNITGKCLKFFKLYTTIVLCLGACCMLVDINYYRAGGVNQNHRYSEATELADDLVSAKTMEGYFWLRDNTPEDSVIVVDRHTENLDNRQIYFYCSAFSERQCYIEGFDYTDVSEEKSAKMLKVSDSCYATDAAVAEAALDSANADYLVVTKFKHPAYVAGSNMLSLVFENSDVQIYQYAND